MEGLKLLEHHQTPDDGPCSWTGLTLSLRWAGVPPGGRGRRPTRSVSSHPRPARSAPSVWPPSARSGSRPGPPGGTGRSWRRPLWLTPGSVPLEVLEGFALPPKFGSFQTRGRGVSERQRCLERDGADGMVTRRRAVGGLDVQEGTGLLGQGTPLWINREKIFF